MPNSHYIGRFAPSPTGPLHLGSLVAAMASYLDARTANGRWLVRIEDVDTVRRVAGAAERIIDDLDTLGFQWDSKVVYQSERSQQYEQALGNIEPWVFECSCSRAEQLGQVYDGRCRNNQLSSLQAERSELLPGAWAVRLRTTGCVRWHDRSGEVFDENLDTECGDFVLKRRDGLWAYQLAVVVDDYLQGVTHVVRGRDLIDSTARQIYLQHRLGYPTPTYWHTPLVLAKDGLKLSKQNGATSLNIQNPVTELVRAWSYLSPEPIEANSVNGFWNQAFKLFFRRPAALPPDVQLG